MAVREGLTLLCRVGTRLCSLPLEHVVETMRPLPVEPLHGTPSFVCGLAIIRGVPVPVVDAGRLLGTAAAQPARFVTLKISNRRVALAVDRVLCVSTLPAGSLAELPPLLRETDAEVVSEIGVLDAELLLVLRSARLVPENLWALLATDGLL